MAFITPCFIRKNTLELRKNLEELGYTCLCRLDGSASALRTTLTSRTYITFNHLEPIVESGKWIDCGENETLFLALAALRDDSDRMQWYTNGEKWYKFTKHYNKEPNHTSVWRKATVHEIIEHFSCGL